MNTFQKAQKAYKESSLAFNGYEATEEDIELYIKKLQEIIAKK